LFTRRAKFGDYLAQSGGDVFRRHPFALLLNRKGADRIAQGIE
jgi:hypothetical protein